MIRNIISALQTATNLPVKPMFTTEIDNQIIYSHYAVIDNGARSQQRLEIRLITKTYSEAESYRKQIIGALVPIGDSKKIEGITACELNGGGSLYEGETKTYHTLLYFDYITKSENGGLNNE